MSVCTSKEVGGLGLRRLRDQNMVYGLKLIWLLFAGNDSLWVAWIAKHIIGERLFWLMISQILEVGFGRVGFGRV